MTISMASIRSFTFAVIAGLTLAGCGYNTIPTLEEQAKAKWGDVQNNYQRRADLIPNLVATVQGYAKQEKDVLTSVIEARAKALGCTHIEVRHAWATKAPAKSGYLASLVELQTKDLRGSLS